MIIKNQRNRIATNFFESEFYCKSEDAPEEHYFDERLVSILDKIRNYYDVRVDINSTFRTKAHQLKITEGKSDRSAHCLGIAVDFSIRDDESFSDFIDSVRSRGLWYEILREEGVAGIGLYNSFVHIDTRGDNYPFFTHDDKYGRVSLWGKW